MERQGGRGSGSEGGREYEGSIYTSQPTPRTGRAGARSAAGDMFVQKQGSLNPKP